MAQKVQVVLIDDIDGGSAVETVVFTLDGAAYEIDLSKKNATALRDAMAPWVGAARKVTGPRGRRGRGRSRHGGETAKIRAWAKGQGLPVNERGRISADVREKYEAAH